MHFRLILLFTYLGPLLCFASSCSLNGEKLAHFLSCACFYRRSIAFFFLLPALLLFCPVSHSSAVLCLFWQFFLFSMLCCLCLLSAHFTILYVLIFCCSVVFFTSSSIAVGPRIDALRPLEELIPCVLAASKAPSTVKGYHSQF